MEIIRRIVIKEKDIDDIMVTALEGGINYWCDSVDINHNPANKEYASEIIAYGGELGLNSMEGGKFVLYRNMIVDGIDKAMTHFGYDSFDSFMDNLDADLADAIVQFAIFHELRFG